MSASPAMPASPVPSAGAIRARAKVLAREDYAMRSDLVALRRQAGLTQKQVAERMGVTQQAVHKLERYDSDPKLSTVRRYANAVGALIEHRVAPDMGQSVLLAATPPWQSVSTATALVPLGRAERRVSELAAPWIGDRLTSFALAS